MMLSAVSCHGKIFTITSLQALSLEFFHSCPPQWTQGPGNWGTPRDRNVDIFGLVCTERTSQLPCMPPHTLTCGHSGKHSHAHNDSTTAEKWCSRISNKSYYINKKLNKIIILKNFNKKVLLRKHTYLSSLSRHLTKIGRIPDFIKSSMGGFLSLESSFLKKNRMQKKLTPEKTRKNWYLHKSVSSATHLAACTALSCITALSLVAFCSEQEQ